jgi:hypothetical protein
MRYITRIHYNEDTRGSISEPLFLGEDIIEVAIRPTYQLTGTPVTWIVRKVITGFIIASKGSRTCRSAKVGARRWLIENGANLGLEARKKL